MSDRVLPQRGDTSIEASRNAAEFSGNHVIRFLFRDVIVHEEQQRCCWIGPGRFAKLTSVEPRKTVALVEVDAPTSLDQIKRLSLPGKVGAVIDEQLKKAEM